MAISTKQRFLDAAAALVDDVKRDEHILAVVLCGSLAYDEVWDKSDIDLHIITEDDRKIQTPHLALSYDDINVHANIENRSEFRKHLQATTQNLFGHSMFARARLIYSKDPSIDELFENMKILGEYDRQMQMMHSASHAVFTWYKAKKWFQVKDDLPYSAFWMVQAARFLSEVIVSGHGELVDRESIVRAQELDPVLFQKIYSDLFLGQTTRKKLSTALTAFEEHIEPKAEVLFEPILVYLRSAAGEARSVSDINHYFKRHYNIEDSFLACEWLSDLGIIDKASTPVKLTTQSQHDVEELAFFVV